MRTSVFVISQGSPYACFRRALDSRNKTVALATATELDFVSLPDALELVSASAAAAALGLRPAR